MKPASLPSPIQTTLVLAASADGKIADVSRQAARFSSAADLHHLETQVADADAVLTGGGTLRAYGTILSVRQPTLRQQRQARGQPPQPLQVIWSPSGNVDPHCRFFQQPVPRGLITTTAGAELWRSRTGFDQIWEMPSQQPPWDWNWVYQQLAKAGVSRLALLGGGHLVAELMAHDLVDDIALTLCPLILGGASAPTPVDGLGFEAARAPTLTLVSSQVVGQEIFLHYRVNRAEK